MKPRAAFLIWVLFLALAGPSFLLVHWEGALVVFAALLLAPAALTLLRQSPGPAALPAASLLAVGYLVYPSPFAWWLALPYPIWAVYRSWICLRTAKPGLLAALRVAAHGYWVVGAVWAVSFLAQYAPLGFDATITHLTAAHFHLAGLVLTTAVVCLLERGIGGRWTRGLGWTALAGMPAVAAGIVATHFGFPPIWETLAGEGFAAFAILVALLHIGLVFQRSQFDVSSRRLWLIAGLSLFAGGSLAALYALRVYLPIEWVTITNMKCWHGTLNTLGFGACCLWGWVKEGLKDLKI